MDRMESAQDFRLIDLDLNPRENKLLLISLLIHKIGREIISQDSRKD